MKQPPFNPLQELAEDTSGITFRAGERLKKWMEYHNEAYKRETCPIGGCDPVEPIQPQSNEIKTWGDCIVWQKSKEYMAECKIDWNIVRERMNVWMTDTQNPECQNVFFAYNEAICNALAKEDCPPNVDESLVKYHNLGKGWHGFSYPTDNDDHIGEINVLLLDAAWGWIMEQVDEKRKISVGIQALVFGRLKVHENGKSRDTDAYVKFKVV